MVTKTSIISQSDFTHGSQEPINCSPLPSDRRQGTERSAGYDIRSYEPDGTHRFIEVKTTRGGATTSFFISPNEIAFSAQNPDSYVLFRLYDFDDESGSAKTYLLTGNIASQLSLEPTAYRAKLNAGNN